MPIEPASTPDQLPGLDASVRTLVDEVREVARSAVADAELAAAWGIDLNNPFLDPSVVDAVLRTPLDRRPPLHSYKPLLSSAMAGLLPHAVASRQTKGSFEADHYAGLRANMPELLELAHGRLAEMGLIDTTRLVQCLGQAARRRTHVPGCSRTSPRIRGLAGGARTRTRTRLDLRTVGATS